MATGLHDFLWIPRATAINKEGKISAKLSIPAKIIQLQFSILYTVFINNVVLPALSCQVSIPSRNLTTRAWKMGLMYIQLYLLLPASLLYRLGLLFSWDGDSPERPHRRGEPHRRGNEQCHVYIHTFITSPVSMSSKIHGSPSGSLTAPVLSS